MKRLTIRLLCTASIFLCAIFSTSAEEPDWDQRALALEREIYAANTPAVHNSAVMKKVEIRKQQGLYKEALSELSRIYVYALGEEELEDYYYQRALVSYLAGDFELALTTIDEANIYISQRPVAPMMLLVEALAAGEKGEWSRSQTAAEKYTAQVANDQELKAQIEALYNDTPTLRNPEVAYWLSLVPGLGQFYAGEVWSGLVSLVANGALMTFGVSEMMAGEWLSGWIVGCGGLSTSYFVGQERARTLTERRNQRVLREHNDQLRSILLNY